MRRELGIARCGLACCLCFENEDCGGCDAGGCPDVSRCQNIKCSTQKHLSHCFMCDEKECHKGILDKLKPHGFNLFAKRYGIETLLDCLERNEKNGIIYHRDGIMGDYDEFDDVEALIAFIKTGKK